MRENLQNIHIQPLKSFSTEHTTVDLLRLDLFHPVISGNKWFKLQFYLQDAVKLGKRSIATFGGAYSNHIVATAFAASELGLQSLGLIRGDEPGVTTPTLQEAANYGMELIFLSRASYRNKAAVQQTWNKEQMYWIKEGGYGEKGALGASEILKIADTSRYTHIACAVGTGTMMAGLINGADNHQQVLGISVLRNHLGLEKEVYTLLNKPESSADFAIYHDYHFGGYAKQTPALFDFMKEIWFSEGIPTDIVYTSKLLYGIRDLVQKNHFGLGSRVLVIHSGGLQGNRSVSAGILPF